MKVQVEQKLVEKKINPTAMRLLVLDLLLQQNSAISLSDIEKNLEPADRTYAALRAQLEAAGSPIGGNDMLIAAHAISLGCTVVTDNEREFVRVDGLAVENWLR